jgi:hypothetical protein
VVVRAKMPVVVSACSQWIERWGLDVAKKLDREIRTGFENFKDLTREIDCDAHDGDTSIWRTGLKRWLIFATNTASAMRFLVTGRSC